MLFHASLTIFSILASALSAPLADVTYPDPICSGACSNQVHDPSVVRREDGTYFRFATQDLISIATAPSLAGPWTMQGSVLSEPSKIELEGRDALWAPDCFLHNGTYYLFYAVSAMSSHDSDIGVATSTTMDPGTWADHGSIGIPFDASYNKIDPNLFHHDPNAPFYLAFGSFWQDIFQVEMQGPPLRIAAGAEMVHLERDYSDRGDRLHVGAAEGAYQFWWVVDGKQWYYLFFSAGNCCNDAEHLAPAGEEYKILVCRSDRPTGGFVDNEGIDCLEGGGTLVLGSHGDVYAPGGQGVMWDPELGSVVVYYHYVKPSVGYEYEEFWFGWNKLEFGSGWPVVVD